MAERKPVREPIATWWRINSYKVEMLPVQVTAFTAAFVTFLDKEWRYNGPDVMRERREARHDIFPTFEEAKAEYIRRVTAKVENAKRELQQARSELGQIESLKESV